MTDPTSSRYGPSSTDSTQWESCPSLIQHTLMDTVSSMNMNECNIYNILIPSSSSIIITIIQVCSYILTSFNHNPIIIIYKTYTYLHQSSYSIRIAYMYFHHSKKTINHHHIDY